FGRLDLESAHVADVHSFVRVHDGAGSRVIDDPAERVGGEGQIAVDEQRVPFGDVLPVRALAVTGLIPHHAQVHVPVTDVVGHEVRPVDVDRVQFDLPVGAGPQAHGVLDHGEVRAAQDRV